MTYLLRENACVYIQYNIVSPCFIVGFDITCLCFFTNYICSEQQKNKLYKNTFTTKKIK